MQIIQLTHTFLACGALLLHANESCPCNAFLSLWLEVLQVPDALVEQSLQRSGVGDPDARTTRLIGLAAHKLVVDMASTAYERSSQRARSTAKTRREHGVEALAQRHVLTSDDVVSAAEAAGVPMRQRTHFPSSTSPDTG